MGDGVEVKLDVNQLITQLAQGWEALETSSHAKNTLCRGGKVIGSQPDVHWDSLTGWDDEVEFVVTSQISSNRGSRPGILPPFWDNNEYDILCTYQKGGGLDGHGKFLQNVGFQLRVTKAGGPGTGGSVEGFFDDPANRGTAHDPIAELTAHITCSNGNNNTYRVTLNGETGHTIH
jgi:hypothetical protein